MTSLKFPSPLPGYGTGMVWCLRHEKPTDPDDPLSDQNMKDRYYGTSDPVADKLLNRAKAMPVLKPPEDKTITTLYVGNLGEDGYIDDKDLRYAWKCR